MLHNQSNLVPGCTSTILPATWMSVPARSICTPARPRTPLRLMSEASQQVGRVTPCAPSNAALSTSGAQGTARPAELDKVSWSGFLRPDGRKGVRNLVLVVYTVECAQHVSHAIGAGEDDVHVIGFPGCYDNQYAIRLMLALCRHPNVGAVLAVGLGCEYTRPDKIAEVVRESGRPTEWFRIQDVGGTKSSVERGKSEISNLRSQISNCPRVSMTLADLVVGCECGGSDGTSGLAGNPVVGAFFDRLVDASGSAIFEEIVEMIGLKQIMLDRAAS